MLCVMFALNPQLTLWTIERLEPGIPLYAMVASTKDTIRSSISGVKSGVWEVARCRRIRN